MVELSLTKRQREIFDFIKRYFREADHIRLQPENDSVEPIRTREAVVLGKVVGVCRRVS